MNEVLVPSHPTLHPKLFLPHLPWDNRSHNFVYNSPYVHTFTTSHMYHTSQSLLMEQMLQLIDKY